MPRPNEYPIASTVSSDDILLLYQNGQMKKLNFQVLVQAIIDQLGIEEGADFYSWSDE